MRELCEVLDYLHTRKPRILHSDIKPANIMVTPKGTFCLIDFNIFIGRVGNAGSTGTEQTVCISGTIPMCDGQNVRQEKQ